MVLCCYSIYICGMKKLYIFTFPLVLIADIYAITQITSLLSQPNDIAVLFGILTMCALLALHYYYIKSFINQFKTKKK